MSSNTVVPPAADAPAVGSVAPDAPASNPVEPGTAVDQVTQKLAKAEIHQQKQKVKKEKAPQAPALKLEVSNRYLALKPVLVRVSYMIDIQAELESGRAPKMGWRGRYFELTEADV